MSIEKDIKFAEKTRAELMEKFPADLDKIEGRIFERLSKSKRSNLTKLDNLYAVMSKLSKFVFNYTPCRKFCSKCCYIRVDISEIEIQHIEKSYKIKRNKNIKPDTNGSGSPCCFLKGGACSIYEGRPFMCRRHFFFTPDNRWCGHEVETEQKFPLLTFTEVDKSYDLIRRNSKSFKKYDIREVFGK